jgi:sulfur-oxidizing protein SoxZ
MMKNTIRVRTSKKGEATEIKMLIRHPMDTGLMKDKAGKTIPAHFIEEVTCRYKDQTVFQALWGIAVSKNPFLSFTLTDVKKGDSLQVGWVDNKGETDSTVVTL